MVHVIGTGLNSVNYEGYEKKFDKKVPEGGFAFARFLKAK